MAARFVMKEPALAPLFVAVGLGVVGSVAFATHYLRNNQDVVIRKNRSADYDGPWNAIAQDKNTKLFSYNKDAWASRANMPDPRASFMATDGELASSKERIAAAKAKAIAKANAMKESSA